MIKSGLKQGTVVLWAGGGCPIQEGAECTITEERADGYSFSSAEHDCWEPYTSFKLKEEEVNGLEIGTVYLDEDDDELTVLAVIDGLVALSEYNAPEKYGRFVTAKQLSEDYKLKGAEPEVKELTMQEVAELAGIDVDKLRIKE